MICYLSEAKTKRCPLKPDSKCYADECMFWVWEFKYNSKDTADWVGQCGIAKQFALVDELNAAGK